jgi:hypothetical protein
VARGPRARRREGTRAGHSRLPCLSPETPAGARVLAKYEVLEKSDLRSIREHEACWEGQVLDELLLVSDQAEWLGFAPTGSVGGGVERAVSALNLGGPVLTTELSDATLPRSRPGAAAFLRSESVKVGFEE